MLEGRLLHRVVNAEGEIEGRVEVPLVQEGEDLRDPAELVALAVVANGSSLVDAAGREHAVRRVIVVQREAKLHQMVLALRAAGGFTRLLHRGEQQCNQDGNDGDHDEQLDQREAAVTRRGSPTVGRGMQRETRFHG
jgi:hypothetical protein